MASWLQSTIVQAPRNGSLNHTVSFAAATSGNLLLLVMEGAVTHTTPSGWTRKIQALNQTELSVYTKTASASESSFTTTHNAADYPIVAIIYEFVAGSTWVGGVGATGLNTQTGVNPTLSGLTGSNVLFGAVGITSNAGQGANSTTWSGTPTPIEAVDLQVVNNTVTDGYGFSLCYVEDTTATSFSPLGNMLYGATKEAVTFAINVATVSVDTVSAGLDQSNIAPWSTVTLAPSSSTGTVAWSVVSGAPVTPIGSGLAWTFVAPPAMTATSTVLRATAGAAIDDTTISYLPSKNGIVASTSPLAIVPIRFSRTTSASVGRIYVTPDNGSAAQNGTITLSLRINPITPVTVVETTVNFDSSKVQFVSIDTSASPFDASVEQTVATSTVKVARAKLDSAGISTDALIATITFKSLALNGTSPVTLSSANAAFDGAYTNPSSTGATVNFIP